MKPNKTSDYFLAFLLLGAALIEPAAAEYAPLPRTASEGEEEDVEVGAAAPDEEEEEEEDRCNTSTSLPRFFPHSA